MKPENRKIIYDYLKECGCNLTEEQHKILKKFLQEALPDQVSAIYDEEGLLLEE